MPESVQAAAELGVDISGHVARRLTAAMAEQRRPPLVHGERAPRHARHRLGPRRRAFTLKELVRLLETLPAPPSDAGPDDLAGADRRGRTRPAAPAPSRLPATRTSPTRSGSRWRLPRDRVGARDVERPARGRPVRHGRGRRCGGEGREMRIAMGADHAGFPLKEDLKGFLEAEGHQVHRRRDGLDGRRSTTRRSARPPRARSSDGRRRPGDRARADRGRASRSSRTRSTGSARRSATTSIPRGWRASTTTPTCWGWGRA